MLIIKIVQVGEKSPKKGINSTKNVPPNLAEGNFLNLITHQRAKVKPVKISSDRKRKKSAPIQSSPSLVKATIPIRRNSIPRILFCLTGFFTFSLVFNSWALSWFNCWL